MDYNDPRLIPGTLLRLRDPDVDMDSVMVMWGGPALSDFTEFPNGTVVVFLAKRPQPYRMIEVLTPDGIGSIMANECEVISEDR